MVTVIQRFGGDLSANVHFHSLVLDGVCDEAGAFTPINAPTLDEMEKLTRTRGRVDLECATVVTGDDRERLEHLCKYVLRPPLADRRLRLLESVVVSKALSGARTSSWFSMEHRDRGSAAALGVSTAALLRLAAWRSVLGSSRDAGLPRRARGAPRSGAEV